MNPYQTIRLAGMALADGETGRSSCPWCTGGNAHEQCFVVTRYGGTIKYHCFRASCGGPSSGAIGGNGDPTYMRPVKEKPKPKVFDWETYDVGPEVGGYLWEKYSIDEAAVYVHRILQSSGGDIVVPIHNRRGMISGRVIRLRNPRHQKVLTYHEVGSNGLAWFNHAARRPDRPLVIVEDVFSAIRCAAYTHSVALLGTDLNAEQAQDIAAGAYPRVILLLDDDASAKAVRLAVKHRTNIPYLEVVRLAGPDVKDMPIAQSDRLFSRLLKQEKQA